MEYKNSSNLIAMTEGVNAIATYELALAFQEERDILLPESKAKGQRKAIREMLGMGVKPEHIRQAVMKLVQQGMTFTDLFGVSKTAIDLANQPKKIEPERLPETPLQRVVRLERQKSNAG